MQSQAAPELSNNSVIEQVTDALSILLVGLGREAKSTYQFLTTTRQLSLAETVHFFVADDEPIANLDTFWQELVAKGKITYIENDPTQLPNDKMVAFASPGVRPSHPLLIELESNDVPIISNTELALHILPSSVDVIGVTGTKGKSTTAAMIHHVLGAGSIPVYLGGNIGIPPLDVVSKILEQDQQPTAFNAPSALLVLELSAHQLRLVSKSPHIAVVLNVSQEHLDYFPSHEAYRAAKLRITNFQSDQDIVICNNRHSAVTPFIEESKAKKQTFGSGDTTSTSMVPSESQLPAPIAILTKKTITYNGEDVVSDVTKLRIVGSHTLENALPSVIVAKEYGIDSQQISERLHSFTSLPHRLELILDSNGITYINDSLSTTPESAVAALRTFSDRPVLLIAGGHDRHLDFTPLATQLLQQSITALIVFPPTGEQIMKALYLQQPNSPLLTHAGYKVTSMSEAVNIAKRLAKSGDVILLSPGSASFGMFKDYADRGNQFKAAVLAQT